MLSGKVKRNNFDGKLTFDKPTYSIMTGESLEDKNSNLNIARIVPIYTVCEDLSIKVLRRAIFNAIQKYKDEIENVIPEFLRKKIGLLDKKIAVEQIHFPETQELLEQARFSLIFEELFLIQLKMVRLTLLMIRLYIAVQMSQWDMRHAIMTYFLMIIGMEYSSLVILVI